MQDYIYALITGYVDPPAGVDIREGLNYSAFILSPISSPQLIPNSADPYFPGGAIGMARVLYDGLVEYPDVRLSPSFLRLEELTFATRIREPRRPPPRWPRT